MPDDPSLSLADGRALAGAVRDLARVQGDLVQRLAVSHANLGHLVDRLADVHDRLGAVERAGVERGALLRQVQLHYEALNAAREKAAADLTTAEERARAAKANLLADWFDRLSPRKLAALITGLLALLAALGLGGLQVGVAGRAQRVFDALSGAPAVVVSPPDEVPDVAEP